LVHAGYSLAVVTNGRGTRLTSKKGAAVPGSYVNMLFYFLIVGAGVSVAFQQVLNANLRMELGSAWWAGFISYLTGTLAMLAIAVASGEPWLSGAMAERTSWISWTGGLFGAIFIATAILMVPRFGAATVLALVVVGQMLGSVAFDHFGLLGIQQHSANPVRLAGAAFLILGVVLIRF
jgi:bacterial/archaeal transporter family-2 protein